MIYAGSMAGSTVPLAPKNPLREIRLSLGLSLDRLAREARVSRQLIIRAEQAVYSDPPPRLLKTLLWLDVDEYSDAESVIAQYHAFQVQTRKLNYGALIPNFNFKNLVPPGQHPFVVWRVRSGVKARIGPAKFFCVHPALLHKFEVQPHLVVTPPSELMLALAQSGYTKEFLASFAKAYDDYKNRRRQILGVS